MFELTNEQRKCFALPPVLDTWKKIEVKPSPYDLYDTYVYLDGQKIMKVIQIYEEAGHPKYYEYSVDQMISEDGKKLLPKTAKGKPQNFISSHLERKPHVGMALYFERGFVCVTNNTAEQSYYRSAYEDIQIKTLDDFRKWLEIVKVSDAGTVLLLKAGNLTLSGDEIRTALSLRSASFEIKYTDTEIIISTKGYGHGVGMSQYGANSMAQEGKSWQDIINHYYKNCQITIVS
jgi:SpoIID/LytB domain protein